VNALRGWLPGAKSSPEAAQEPEIPMQNGHRIVTNIKLEGAAMKPIETPSRQEGQAAVLAGPAVAERVRNVRQVPLANVSPALVTLASADADLDPKQLTMAEQFRLLRTRVKTLSKDFKLRTILITSALPGEGKTTVSANLAVSLSRVEGLRVLLLDFDLRHPSLHKVFGMEPDRPSPFELKDDTRWQDSVCQVNHSLDVLFGFRPHEEPDRLLQSNRLEKMLNDARAEYDVIVLDSAPLLAVSDTQSLVPLVDCGLFVLNADVTPVIAAREALTMLQDKVAGCIVNRVQNLKSEGYYRSSGYGYGYGSKRTEN
jgi:capsular exopolysaccharide synthesis family protein